MLDSCASSAVPAWFDCRSPETSKARTSGWRLNDSWEELVSGQQGEDQGVGPLDWAAIVLAVLVPRLAGVFSMSVFDDAFITFRHSLHLASGQGFVFNVGDRILGTTSPLFALILAALAWAGAALPPSAIVLGIASDVLTAAIGFRILRLDVGREAASCFLLFFAADPHIIRVAVGGMESSLFLAITMAVAFLLGRGQAAWALVVSSAAIFVRPEAAWLWLVCLGALWLQPGKLHRGPWTVAAIALIVLASLGLWLYFGSPLPNSVASKARGVGGSLTEVLLIFFFPKESPVQSVLTILAIPGVVAVFRRSAASRWLLVWTAGYIAAYLLARPAMWTWYALPVYGAKALCAAVFVGTVLARLGGARVRMWLTPWVAACAAAAFGVLLAVIAGASPVRRFVYQPLEAWCGEHVTRGQAIAAGDVGAIGYWSEAFIYDLAGLVWRDRWRYASTRDVILTTKPDFVFAGASQYWAELFDPRSELRQLYKPVKRFSRYGNTNLEPTVSELAPGWVQDYVVFERLPQLGQSASSKQAAR
jgi:hypothetical protein